MQRRPTHHPPDGLAGLGALAQLVSQAAARSADQQQRDQTIGDHVDPAGGREVAGQPDGRGLEPVSLKSAVSHPADALPAA